MPLDRAVWWIEWILRNPDPTYLRSPTLDLGFFRSNIYDIILFYFILVPFIIWYLSKKFIVCISNVCKGKKDSNSLARDKKKR